MNYTMSDLEDAFREGFQSSHIGNEDKAWEESKTKAKYAALMSEYKALDRAHDADIDRADAAEAKLAALEAEIWCPNCLWKFTVPKEGEK